MLLSSMVTMTMSGPGGHRIRREAHAEVVRLELDRLQERGQAEQPRQKGRGRAERGADAEPPAGSLRRGVRHRLPVLSGLHAVRRAPDNDGMILPGIDEVTLRGLVTPADAVIAVRDAFRADGEGRTVVPASSTCPCPARGGSST